MYLKVRQSLENSLYILVTRYTIIIDELSTRMRFSRICLHDEKKKNTEDTPSKNGPWTLWEGALPWQKQKCSASHTTSKKKPVLLRIFLFLRKYVRVSVYDICVRGKEISIYINRDIDTYIVFHPVNRVWCFTLALSSGCHAKNTSVRQNTKNHNQCLPLFRFLFSVTQLVQKNERNGWKKRVLNEL